MNQTIIVQGSPRVEIIFYENEFQIRSPKKLLLEVTKYHDIKTVEFIKGKIPWVTGTLTTIIDLVSGHGGLGGWKRGKGSIVLQTDTEQYIVELKNYDREQTPIAVQLLNEKKTDIQQNV